MKTILPFLSLALFINGVHGQQRDSSVYTREYYIQKSKDNKTIGNVLLIGGLGLSLLGVASFGGGGTDYSGGALFLLGLGGALVSIPFYVSSRQNLMKALELSAGAVRVSGVPQCGVRNSIVQPALVLRLNIP